MKQVIFLLGFLLAQSAYSQTTSTNSNDTLRRELRDLAFNVQEETYQRDVSTEQLQEAKVLLLEAIKIMRDGAGTNSYEACVRFAHENYLRSLPNTMAIQRAQAACKNVSDNQVLEYLFQAYSTGLPTTMALDRAAQNAGEDLKRKVAILRFSHEKYGRSLPTIAAVERAIEKTKTVTARSLNCLESYYGIFSRSTSAILAMDQAFNSCTTQN